MIAKIQIPDSLEIGKIYKGSIYLTANAEGSFRKYNISSNSKIKRAFKKLSHGRMSWNNDDIRLSISIDRNEHRTKPSEIVYGDCESAYLTLLEMEE